MDKNLITVCFKKINKEGTEKSYNKLIANYIVSTQNKRDIFPYIYSRSR